MTEYWKNFPDIDLFLKDVEALIFDILEHQHFPLGKDITKLFKAGGKMLRPGFVYIGAEFGLANSKKKWNANKKKS